VTGNFCYGLKFGGSGLRGMVRPAAVLIKHIAPIRLRSGRLPSLRRRAPGDLRVRGSPSRWNGRCRGVYSTAVAATAASEAVVGRVRLIPGGPGRSASEPPAPDAVGPISTTSDQGPERRDDKRSRIA
jgi:hypothetical protein